MGSYLSNVDSKFISCTVKYMSFEKNIPMILLHFTLIVIKICNNQKRLYHKVTVPFTSKPLSWLNVLPP